MINGFPEKYPEYITTYKTGRRVYLATLNPGDIHIEDIGHALSNLCRFAGHCREFYSVAQHSVRVANIVSPENQLCALLHDATEAYVADVPGPWKKLLPDYRNLEDAFWRVIAERFNLPRKLPEEVKQADRLLLQKECHELTFNDLGKPENVPDQAAMPSNHAYISFMRAYYTLTDQKQGQVA